MNSNYCILTRPEPLCNTEYEEEDKDPKVLSCSLPAVIPTVKPRGWVTELAFPRMNLSLFLVNCLMINYCHSQQTALLFPLNFSGFIVKSWRETGGCISVPLQDCQSYTWCNRSVLHLIFESQQTHTSSALLFRTFSKHPDHVCAAGCHWHGFSMQGQGVRCPWPM